MKNKYLLIIVGALLCSSCATQAIPQDRTTDEAMLNFLPYLNQKVAGYLEANPECKLNSESYKKIIDEKCGVLLDCRKNSAILFETYKVQARILDGMFSVMTSGGSQLLSMTRWRGSGLSL